MNQKTIWDAHSCVALNPTVDLNCLRVHHQAGTRAMSLNIAMDMTPLPTLLSVLASFKKQITQSDFLYPVRTLADVDVAVAQGKLGIYFDLEGVVALHDNSDWIYLMHDLGVRQVHFAYNRNNSVAGGCHDMAQGLTALGKRFVDAINDCGMLMDVSHTGEQSSLEIMAYSQKPVIYSHANPRALVDHARNISDEQIKTCVATGGVVCLNGVGRFLHSADKTANAHDFVEHIGYVVDLVGIDHVGLGLDYCHGALGVDDLMPADFDKHYWWPKDYGYEKGLMDNYLHPDQLPTALQLLAEKGFSPEDIEKICFSNLYRCVKSVWND